MTTQNKLKSTLDHFRDSLADVLPIFLFRITAPKAYRKQQAAAIHNATEARAHQLPTEILLLIGDHLAPASTILVRQTCQRMRYTISLSSGFFPLNKFD
ncbi:uncharacterized protein BDZ99DRAFT_465927 [Mytilinidion resinicola]|uniref:F-box domain-containing protein n=1 Tax=Mytilinidion resinicola TaxID=574789 RepID=A0A6A6YCF9_9PEZI|nr:uncharacterized protein BDZ99DRAFT_465927 [Mytilinidion resinicola]KAF2806289.1 hypothetical protein BDZ99DRAFT_465927 [Mytilinidion resinicola]